MFESVRMPESSRSAGLATGDTIGFKSRVSLGHRIERWARRLVARLPSATDERGDVPGWVLVTLMTAAMVAAIWALAETALSDLFEEAITSVTSR